MKITKSQLRQIIKEEVAKEINSDENIQEFLGGLKKFLKGGSDQLDPYSAKEQSAIEQLALRIETDKEGKYKEATQKMYRKDRVKGEEAISVAIAMLGEPGFSRKKSSPEKGPTLRQRSVAAGTKKPERYYDHESKGFKVR